MKLKRKDKNIVGVLSVTRCKQCKKTIFYTVYKRSRGNELKIEDFPKSPQFLSLLVSLRGKGLSKMYDFCSPECLEKWLKKNKGAVFR